ncbi:MAG: RHS repeat-associated core domain-containing protein [Oscillospiraceae bacterium]
MRGTNLVAKYNYWNGDKSEYTYYTQNAHGDVVNLTDKDGKVTKSYRYDAFGVEKNIDENDTNAFRYCGEYYDAEMGTIYLRARYYNPSTGRFISRDSFAGRRSDPLSLNLYTYCRNNPIRFIDPSGHITVNSQWDWAYYVAKGDINYEYYGGNGEVAQRAQNILTYSRASADEKVKMKKDNQSNPTKTSDKGIEAIKEFEYFMPDPYIASDWETNYTIGYGHVIHDGGTSVEMGGQYYSSLTEEQATALLSEDLSNVFEPNLNDFLYENNIVLTQEQYDACIMDSFQKGQNIWGNSEYAISNYILSRNYGSYNECLAAFLGETENEGLINRRTKEADIFYNGY